MNQQNMNGVAEMSVSKPDLAEIINQNINSNLRNFPELSVMHFPVNSVSQHSLANDYNMCIPSSLVQHDPNAFNLMNVSKYMCDPLKNTVANSNGNGSMFNQMDLGDCTNSNSLGMLSSNSNFKNIGGSPSKKSGNHYPHPKQDREQISNFIQENVSKANFTMHGLGASSGNSSGQSVPAFSTSAMQQQQLQQAQRQSSSQQQARSQADDVRNATLSTNAATTHTSTYGYQKNSQGSFNSPLDSLPSSSAASSMKVVCDICGRGFATGSYLQQHKRIHSGERPYECRHCGKKFTQMSHVKQHERVHTGERPYVCEICDKRFTQLSNLRSHQKGHHQAAFNSVTNSAHYMKSNTTTGQQTVLTDSNKLKSSHQEGSSGVTNLHPCNRCGQTFMNLSDLVHHQGVTHRTNKGRPKGKSQPCPLCGKQYTSESMFRKHLLERHEYNMSPRESPGQESTNQVTKGAGSNVQSVNACIENTTTANVAKQTSDCFKYRNDRLRGSMPGSAEKNHTDENGRASATITASTPGSTSTTILPHINLNFLSSNLQSGLDGPGGGTTADSSVTTAASHAIPHAQLIANNSNIMGVPHQVSSSAMLTTVSSGNANVLNNPILFPTAAAAQFFCSIPASTAGSMQQKQMSHQLQVHANNTSSLGQSVDNCLQDRRQN